MLFAALIVVGSLALIGLSLYLYATGNNDYWHKKGVPFVDANKIESIFKRMSLQVSFLDFDRKMYKSLPDVKFFGYNEFRSTVLYVKDLDLVRQILVKDFEFFADRRSIVQSNSKADPLLARMLINVRGAEWKDLRAIMSPTFTTGKIKRMFEFFNGCGHHLVTYLESQRGKKIDGLEEENVVDFQDCFGRYTMDAIANIAFGVPTDTFKEENSTFRNMAKRFQGFSIPRLIGIMMYLLVPFLAKLLRIRVSEPKATDFFSKIVQNNMDMRRKNGESRQDFLQLLLEAQTGQLKVDEGGHDIVDDYERNAALVHGGGKSKESSSAVVLDDTTIISQCILFFLAGADTIESVLTYAVYELAINPEVQEKLADELSQAMDEHGGNLTYEATHQLEYLDMVVSEALRLHPPAFILERLATQNYTLPGTDVVLPKGSRVQIPVASIQADEKYYPNPERFDPENFNSENKTKRHAYAYLPFGQGPRNCIAMRFALTETKAAIAHLVYNFRVEPSKKTQIPVQISKKTFKPDGMWLKFTPRR